MEAIKAKLQILDPGDFQQGKYEEESRRAREGGFIYTMAPGQCALSREVLAASWLR